jgi:hypothetical protein
MEGLPRCDCSSSRHAALVRLSRPAGWTPLSLAVAALWLGFFPLLRLVFCPAKSCFPFFRALSFPSFTANCTLPSLLPPFPPFSLRCLQDTRELGPWCNSPFLLLCSDSSPPFFLPSFVPCCP